MEKLGDVAVKNRIRNALDEADMCAHVLKGNGPGVLGYPAMSLTYRVMVAVGSALVAADEESGGSVLAGSNRFAFFRFAQEMVIGNWLAVPDDSCPTTDEIWEAVGETLCSFDSVGRFRARATVIVFPNRKFLHNHPEFYRVALNKFIEAVRGAVERIFDNYGDVPFTA